MLPRSKCDDTAVRERLRHLVVDDSLRDALDDRRLADARVADQGWVVLRAPGEHLDRLLDLVGAADHRVELSFACHRCEIAAVLVEVSACCSSVACCPSARRRGSPRRAASCARARTAGGAGPPASPRPVRSGEQHVLRAYVRGAEVT